MHTPVIHPEDLKLTSNSVEISELAIFMVFRKIAETLNNGRNPLVLWNNDRLFASATANNNRPHVP